MTYRWRVIRVEPTHATVVACWVTATAAQRDAATRDFIAGDSIVWHRVIPPGPDFCDTDCNCGGEEL